MDGQLAIVLVAVFLVALRLRVFWNARWELALGDGVLKTEPVVLLGVSQYFVLSLCFELATLVALCWLARWGAPSRWLARGALVLLLWINLAGTMVFLVLRTYAKGFQLTGLSFPEMQSVVATFITPLTLLGLVLPMGIGLIFGREGSTENTHQGRSTAALLVAVGLVALAGAAQLIRNPTAYPSIAHSHATLLFVRTLPQAGVAAAVCSPPPGDWAPSRQIAAHWSALGEGTRDFNLVVVVLESVRSDVFWPAPQAPPMPPLAALASHAALFTPAY